MPSFAQLPKRLERCLPNPTLAQEIRDTQTPAPKVYVRVVDIQFDPASRIPLDIQDEISKDVIGRTLDTDANSNYLEDMAKEIAEVSVRGGLQNAGYFRVLADTKLTVLKRDGSKIDAVAHASADIGDQYRLGKMRFESADLGKELFYSLESLREKIPLKRGDLFDVDKIREGLKNLTSMYGENGYIDFTAEPEFDFNDETKTIDLTLRLDPQKQYRIREIEFWGVNPEVEQRLRASYQQSGELFSKSRLEQFIHDNKSLMPKDVRPDEILTFRRDTGAGMVGITFDFRTCPGQISP